MIFNILVFSYLILLVVSNIFRILSLDNIPGINGDEAWIGWKACRFWAGEAFDFKAFSGNISNPFYLLPVVALHGWVEPSGWALRVVAAISGIITLVINYFVAKAVGGVRFALSSSLLLACAPMLIAHSRFGWEPSQVPLVAVGVLALAGMMAVRKQHCWGWLLGCTLVALAGYLVHPTTVFLLPFLGMAFLAGILKPEENWRKCLSFLVISAIGTIVLALLVFWQAPSWVQTEIAQRVLNGVFWNDGWAFLVTWVRQFTGLNTYQYLAGSWPVAVEILSNQNNFRVIWMDWLGLVIFAGAGFILLLILVNLLLSDRAFEGVRLGLILWSGFVYSSAWFWVVSGSGKVAVWFDRYGLWVVVPGLWCLAWAFVRVWDWLEVRKIGWAATLWKFGGMVVCALMLVGFWMWYFGPFLRTGGEAHISSRTAMEGEPKLLAGDYLKQRFQGKKEQELPVVLSGNWFSFWPVYYRLQGKEKRMYPHIWLQNEPDGTPKVPDDFWERVGTRDVVLVEFVDGVQWRTWEKYFGGWEVQEEKTFYDQGKRPVLVVKFLERPR